MRLNQAEVITLSDSWFYRLLTLHGAGDARRRPARLRWERSGSCSGRPCRSTSGMLFSYAAIVSGAVARGDRHAARRRTRPPGPPLAAALDSFDAWRPWSTDVFPGWKPARRRRLLRLLPRSSRCRRARRTAASSARSGDLLPARPRRDSPRHPRCSPRWWSRSRGSMAGAAGTTIIVCADRQHAIDSGPRWTPSGGEEPDLSLGHSAFNLTIYLSAGAVYVLCRVTPGGRGKTTKPIVVAWLFTLVFVATAYSHHLYMDFVQPEVGGRVSRASPRSARRLPPAVVTIFTGGRPDLGLAVPLDARVGAPLPRLRWAGRSVAPVP